ncbi:MAG TPA: hypothetical protein VGH89_37310 [Pseudonocardia sp.]|jgi:hypothetical protein
MTAEMTLHEIRGMKAGPDRIHAITAYIEHSEQMIRIARALRDEDVRALITTHGPAQAAQQSGLSTSTIKSINKGHR